MNRDDVERLEITICSVMRRMYVLLNDNEDKEIKNIINSSIHNLKCVEDNLFSLFKLIEE